MKEVDFAKVSIKKGYELEPRPVLHFFRVSPTRDLAGFHSETACR